MRNHGKKSAASQKFMGYFHRNNPLLKAIILAAAVGISASSPYGAYRLQSAVAKLITKKLEENPWAEDDIRKSLYGLQRTKFIKYTASGNTVKVELTGKGKKRFDFYKFEDLFIKKTKGGIKNGELLLLISLKKES